METVEQIKAETFARLADRPLWMIEETPEGWAVHQWTPDGVAPQSTYPTKRLAAARVLQLLGTGPVAPQTWPESVCIGAIETA